MTIEEMAEKWAASKRQFWESNPISTALNELKYEHEKRKYIEIATESLSSLLEELPEVDKTDYSAIIYQTAYREKIKTLIQNKLK